MGIVRLGQGSFLMMRQLVLRDGDLG